MKEVFNLTERIFELESNPDIKLLEKPLKINQTILINSLKMKSINFLKRNLKNTII